MKKKSSMLTALVLALTVLALPAFLAADCGIRIPVPDAPPKYTVTFDLAGGGDNFTEAVSENEKVTKPADPVNPHMGHFMGWTAETSGNYNLFDFNTPITGNFTLYALWADITVGQTYTVTFVLCEDEGETFTATVEENETVTRPADPVHPVYGDAFYGWIAETDGNGLFDFNTPITGDLTLYAVWSIIVAEKPVIYLYPERETDVTVKLVLADGGFSCTYPEYNDGWFVKAYPDGRLVNYADGFEYSYLFWDAHTATQWDFSSGFVVPGADTAAFLREKLSFMGLTPREYNEFIVFWLPLMQNNAYNLISFQDTVYTDYAALHITPAPDSVLRVFMAYKPLTQPVEIPAQSLSSFERRGFTVVEWGGAAVR